MEFQQLIPIIEGKLYSWAQRDQDTDVYPGPVMSKPIDEPAVDRELYMKQSQQEAFVLRHQYELWEWAVITKTLAKSPKVLQNLVQLRYKECRTWREVAESLHVGERTAFRLRDYVIILIAYEIGMLPNEIFASMKNEIFAI